MGTDNLFKKRRKAREKRKYEFRTPKANSYLIVTEGTRTEPLYFNGIKKLIEEKLGGTICIAKAPSIDIQGKGCSTEKLIEFTDQMVQNAKIPYQHIWIVFDKDDFEDFDDAIEMGIKKGYRIAWSNQSFEYWLYLHFNYSDSALHRDAWNKKLDEIFKQFHLGEGKYKKNDKDIYFLVDTYQGVKTAIQHAKRRMAQFDSQRCKPSVFDPGTTVYQLVEELKSYLDE